MLPMAGIEAVRDAMDGRLQTVIFDLDGTLRHNQPAADDFMYDYAVNLGVEDGPERRRWGAQWAHYYWAKSAELSQDLEAYGEFSERFWINYVVRSLQVFNCPSELARELAPEIQRYMAEQYQPQDVVLPDVPHTLNALRSAGYRLAVLSNRDEPCDEYLAEIELDGYFELTLVAGQVSSWKPSPGLFLHALERLSLERDQTIYVGDNYYADVVGARNAGIQPVLYDPKGVFPNADCPVIEAIEDLKPIATFVS
jgi:HAD superfamily hydrolase (TIGR01549 family)